MPPATHIGKFRIERPLGAGAFATVWLARDEVLDAPVAVKVLAENWSRNDDVRRRFVDEARILHQLDSDRVVRVFAVDHLDDGRPYFVMEWADRGTLYDRMSRRVGGPPTSPREAIQTVLEILRCLSVVHEFGLVHRDVKPSNILFRTVPAHLRRRSGAVERVLLADFGLAKEVVGSSGFTVAAGTPAYTAPEQAGGRAQIDARADVYAATVVLFELLTGAVPYAISTLLEARAPRADQVPQLTGLAHDLPPVLDDIVARGLAQDPDQRFRDADEFADTLAAVLDQLPVEDLASTTPAAVAAPTGPTGHVAHMVHIVARAEALVGADPSLAAIRARLEQPGRLVLVAADPAAAAQAEIALYHAALNPARTIVGDALDSAPDELLSSDVLVLAAVAADVASLVARTRTQLASSVSGPVAMTALVTEPDASELESAFGRSTAIADALHACEPLARVAPVVVADEVVALVERVLLDPAQTVAVSAALAELRARSRRALASESLAAWTQIDDLVDRLHLELRQIEEVDLARADVRGELELPGPLRGEVRRLLFGADSAERLGLAPSADDQVVRAAAAAMLDRWNGLVGAGRIPFRSRPQAEVVVRTLERLWVSVGG